MADLKIDVTYEIRVDVEELRLILKGLRLLVEEDPNSPISRGAAKLASTLAKARMNEYQTRADQAEVLVQNAKLAEDKGGPDRRLLEAMLPPMDSLVPKK